MYQHDGRPSRSVSLVCYLWHCTTPRIDSTRIQVVLPSSHPFHVLSDAQTGRSLTTSHLANRGLWLPTHQTHTLLTYNQWVTTIQKPKLLRESIRLSNGTRHCPHNINYTCAWGGGRHSKNYSNVFVAFVGATIECCIANVKTRVNIFGQVKENCGFTDVETLFANVRSYLLLRLARELIPIELRIHKQNAYADETNYSYKMWNCNNLTWL